MDLRALFALCSFAKLLQSVKMSHVNSVRKRKRNEALKSTGTKHILNIYWSLTKERYTVYMMLSRTIHRPPM